MLGHPVHLVDHRHNYYGGKEQGVDHLGLAALEGDFADKVHKALVFVGGLSKG